MTDFRVELPQKPTHPVKSPKKQWWTLHVNGASRASGSEVEYEIVLVGLNLAITLAATRLEIRSDSQLIVEQIQKEYEAKDELGPLPIAATQKKFLLVATDYFIKWVEIEAYASIKDKDISKRPIGATSFALAYGMEVVIPTKVGVPTARTTVQEQKDNDEELIRHLDWADEVRGKTAIRMASYYQRAITHYNKKTRPQFFRT
ncbi:hypothetical protein AAG906_026090 [Vitis piasezkii]